jgi:hypothetical protein
VVVLEGGFVVVLETRSLGFGVGVDLFLGLVLVVLLELQFLEVGVEGPLCAQFDGEVFETYGFY